MGGEVKGTDLMGVLVAGEGVIEDRLVRNVPTRNQTIKEIIDCEVAKKKFRACKVRGECTNSTVNYSI